MAETEIHGYEVEPVPQPHGSDDGEPSVVVHLGDAGGDVVLTQAQLASIIQNSEVNTPEQFAAAVNEQKEKNAEDWAKNRGPDSELAQEMENQAPPSSNQ